MVAPGTYRENLDFKGKLLTVTSNATSYAQAGRTVLQGDGQNPVVSFHTGETSEASLNGFTVQGGCAPIDNHCAGISIDGAAPRITNNLVTGNNSSGAFIGNGASPALLGNDIKSNDGHGLTIFNAGDIVLSHNIVEENTALPSGGGGTSGGGLNLVAVKTAYAAMSLLLDHNVIRNNIADDGAGFTMPYETVVPNLILINNAFYGNRNVHGNPSPSQIYISGDAYGNEFPLRTALTEINNSVIGGGQNLSRIFAPSIIANNVFYNTTPLPSPYASRAYAGFDCDGGPGYQTDIHNNDIYNVGTQIDGGCNLGANNLDVDPQLKDITNGDLHEQASSPLASVGDITAPLIPTTDLDNKARTVCGKIDIGAYELRPHPPIALTSSANPTPGGGSITFTARLTGNCNVPTGTVTFLDGATVIGTGVLDNAGVASFPTAFLVVGVHNITATYPGDFNFDDSTSPILVQVITGDPTATSLMVSLNPTTAFSPITVSSVVSSQYGTPTGSVVFQAGNRVLATAALDANGRATATVSTLGAGTYSITAEYMADTRFQVSISPVVLEIVVGSDSVTALSSSVNPVFINQPITFMASVRAGQGSNVPMGSVQFLDGTAVIGNAPLSNGVASFVTVNLSLGAHSIVARYQGSSNFNPSSAALTEIINVIGTSLGLTASPNPANGGQAVTLTASAASLVPGTIPSGLVSFRDGTTILGTGTLSASGAATLTTSTLSIGTHPLQVIFIGNGFFGASSSAVVNEVIQAYDFTLNTSQTTLNLPSGDYTRLTVTVTPVGSFHGSVSLACDGVPDHTQCSFAGANPVSLASGAQQVRLTVNTSDLSGYGKEVNQAKNGKYRDKAAETALAALLLPAFGLYGLRRKNAHMRTLLVALTLLGTLMGLQACSGKLPANTLPGSYQLHVTGASTDGSDLNHAAPLTLNVK